MNEKPKLGTTDAALVNCVNLIAAVTATRTEDLIGYLDLYYQVRRTWEIEQGNEEDPRLLRAEDLAPVIREILREYMKSSAREEAETRTAKKKSGPMKASVPTEKPETQQSSEHVAREPARRDEPAKKPGPWTLFKKKQFERLWEAREAGYTIAQIVEASGGALSDRKIMDALNAAQLSQEEWRALEKTLNAVTMLQMPEGPEK